MTAKGDASRVFQRASEAVEKGNYDYAIALFLEVLRSDPGDLRTRMALRQAEKGKFERRGHNALTVVKAALAGSFNLLAALILRLFKKYDAAGMQYEKYLVRNPFSVLALSSLATVLIKAGREDAAIVALEFLRQIKPNHIRTLRHLAHIYEERKDIQRALQRYQMIVQNRPSDIEANKKVHDLAATESIQESWDKGESFHEKIRDRELAERLEQDQHYVRTAEQATDAVTRVKQDIENDPEEPKLWAELGDLQRRKGDYDAASEAYEKALELDPNNQLYVQKAMDTKLQDYRRKIEEAKKRAEENPDDEPLRQEVERLEQESNEFWLEELKRRVEQRPTDTGLRYELGRAYFENEMINEATAEFQRVVRDPKYRVDATAMLGKCFALKGLDELAIEQYEKALQESNLMEEAGKEIAYNLGALYEKTGDYAKAEGAYKKIFEIDIGYRDIAEKMEEVYKKRRAGKGTSNPDENQ